MTYDMWRKETNQLKNVSEGQCHIPSKKYQAIEHSNAFGKTIIWLTTPTKPCILITQIDNFLQDVFVILSQATLLRRNFNSCHME